MIGLDMFVFGFGEEDVEVGKKLAESAVPIPAIVLRKKNTE